MYRSWEDFAIQNNLVLDSGVHIPITYVVHTVTTEKIDVSFLHFNNKRILFALNKVCVEYNLPILPGRLTSSWLHTELNSRNFLFLYSTFVSNFTKSRESNNHA